MPTPPRCPSPGGTRAHSLEPSWGGAQRKGRASLAKLRGSLVTPTRAQDPTLTTAAPARLTASHPRTLHCRRPCPGGRGAAWAVKAREGRGHAEPTARSSSCSPLPSPACRMRTHEESPAGRGGPRGQGRGRVPGHRQRGELGAGRRRALGPLTPTEPAHLTGPCPSAHLCGGVPG